MKSFRVIACAFLALQSAVVWAGPTIPTMAACPAGRALLTGTQNLDSLEYELVSNSKGADPEVRAVSIAEKGPHDQGAIAAGEDFDAARAVAPTADKAPTTSLQIAPDPTRGVVYTAGKRTISSATMKAAPREAPPTTYIVTGKPASKLAQEAVNTTAEMQEIGKGGMQVVYADPTDATKALKVYDGEVMYAVARNSHLKKIEMGEKLVLSGDPEKIAQGQEMIKSAEIELDFLGRGIPPGKTYPTRFDAIATRMVQRTKALGTELRNDVLPKIKIPRTDGAGDIKITMCDGLENVSETGVSRVERVRVGPVDPANPASDQWVEASDYFDKLTPGSRRSQKVLDVDKAWRKQLEPFSDRIKDANQSMGLSLGKGGKLLGYDIGVGKANSPLTNVFVRLDAKGTVLEIKVADF